MGYDEMNLDSRTILASILRVIFMLVIMFVGCYDELKGGYSSLLTHAYGFVFVNITL